MEIVAVREAVIGTERDGTPLRVDDAAIVIEGGRIVEVCGRGEAVARYPGAALRAFPAGSAFPGLVNGHHHIGVTPFQHGVPDLPLECWIVARIAERAIDPYLDTLYSAFEMIASGVTTVLHLYANRRVGALAMLAEAREVIRAYRTVGMRVSFAIMFFDQNPIGYGGEAILQNLTPAEREAVAPAFAVDGQPFDEHAAVLRELRREFCEDEGVRIQLAPGNLQWCSHAALERFAELAAAEDTPVHMHLLETCRQRDYAAWRCGGDGPLAYLRRLGFKGPGVALGHGVWLNATDMDALAESGFSVCHNCSSNMRLASGIAPIRALDERGVNIALGMDEAGINDDRDMLDEMRLAMHLHKAMDPERYPRPLSPGRILRMATEAGAVTTGFAEGIGKLAPRAAADFFVFDAEGASYPAPVGAWTPLDVLLYRGRPAHVSAVFVAGREIYANGRFARVDRDLIIAEIASRLRSADPIGPAEAELFAGIGRKVDALHGKLARTGEWFTR